MLVPGGNERAFQAAATPRSRRERTLVPGGNDASFQAGTNARSGRQRRLVPGKNERSFQAATTPRSRQERTLVPGGNDASLARARRSVTRMGCWFLVEGPKKENHSKQLSSFAAERRKVNFESCPVNL